MNKEILKNRKELTLDSPLDNMFERMFFYQVLKATPDDVIDLADTPKELHDMLLFADEELAEDYKKTVCTFAVNRFMRYMSLGENMEINNVDKIIYKARSISPEFPGVLDLTCWKLGKDICRPKSPKCNVCIFKEECQKVIDEDDK